jgi:hypothetical protein
VSIGFERRRMKSLSCGRRMMYSDCGRRLKVSMDFE